MEDFIGCVYEDVNTVIPRLVLHTVRSIAANKLL